MSGVRKIRLLFVVLFCAAAFALTSLCAAADEALPVSISSVALNKKHTSVEVTAQVSESYLSENEGATLCLIALSPWDSPDALEGKQSCDDAALKSAELSFDCAFDSKTDKFNSYIIAKKEGDRYTALSDAHYLDDAGLLGESSPVPASAAKKGLVCSDLIALGQSGASQTILRVNADDLLLSTSTTDSVSFVYNGTTFYLSKSALDALDAKVRICNDSGINIYARLSLSGKYRGSGDKLAALYCSGAPDGAHGYALNTASREAVGYYEAFIDYIAARYGAPGSEFGYIGSWVVGIEADSNFYMNAAGDMALADYCSLYEKTLRITDTAVRSARSDSRVFVSVSNCWSARGSSSPSLYDVRAFLTSLAALVRGRGDIPFGIMADVSPSDLSVMTVWSDTAAPDSAEAGYMTVKNLDTLCEALAADDLLCAGSPRRLALTFSCTSSADAPSDKTQAAAISYAYYKAAFNDRVEAFIYSVYADEPGRQYTYNKPVKAPDGSTATEPVTMSVCLGLRTADGSTKPGYDVFRTIDASVASDPQFSTPGVTAFALSYIGVNEWSDAVPGYSETALVRRTIVDAMAVLSSGIPSKLKPTVIADFEDGGFDGFYASSGAVYTELRTVEGENGKTSAMLYAGLTPDGGADNMGVACPLNALGAGRAEYVCFDVFAEAPADVSTVEIALNIFSRGGADKRKTLFCGTASVKPNTWQEIAFKTEEIGGAADTLDSLSVSVRSFDGTPHAGTWGLVLDNVTAYGTKPSVFWRAVGIVFLVLLIIAVLLVCGLFAVRIVNVRRMKKRRAAARAARRRSGGTPPARMNTGNSGNANPERPCPAPTQPSPTKPLPPRPDSRPPHRG